ncbi:kinase [Viscerimonas tarda]
MEYYNKIMCVTYGELTSTDGGEPVMKRSTLDQNIARRNIQRVCRGGGEGSCALIVYNSLPEKYRQRYEAKYGDPVELLKKQQMKDKIKLDDKARTFYEAFEYDLNGVQTHLSEKLKDEYTINASVLNVLIRDLNDKVALTKALNNSRRDLWDIITGSCEKLRETYGHTLPNNTARLKDKINRYKKEGYGSLISGKIGNSNTLKITGEAGRQIIALKRCRVPVYTDTQLFDEFNRIAAEKGWKPLKSIRSMKQWFAQPDIEPLWYDAVYGELKAHQRYGRKHQTILSGLRDSLWYGDGTKLNLYYKDENGEMATTMVYEVMDAYSEVLLGYYISDTEDYEAQYNAFRMAVQVSAHKPYEIVTDNQGGSKTKKLQDFYGKISHIHRPTAPNTPQAKSIEGSFGMFQSQVLHQDWRFTGQNITAKKANSRPNLEFIHANKDKLYTLAELKVKYAEAREMWNGTRAMATTGETLKVKKDNKGLKEELVTRWEKYQSSVNEETPEISVLDMVEMFWVKTDKPSTFTSGGIEIEVKGQNYRYEVYSDPGVPDHAWRRKHTYQRFFVKYDPNDFTSVRLYWQDKAGELRFERIAEPYMVIHRNIQEQAEGDAKFIRQEQAADIKDRIERQLDAKEIEYEHGVAPEQNGLQTPKLKSMSNEVNDELQRQIDRRVRKYSHNPLEIAQVNKLISLETFDKLENEEVNFNYKRAAGKL